MRRGVAGEAFELLGDVEGALDHRVVVGFGLQLGLVVDGARQRHRIGRVLRHQLAQLVDLAVGHLQDAADVAQHAARLQRAEGDDLRHLVAAVALLHVADHLVAAVLAEVDVEVRHRYALGVEKTLEQQPEANRIEIGDGQRIGHQRSGAGAAAGADRNPLRLRPLYEVGDDEEVAGIFHAGDDAQFEIEPLAIFLLGMACRDAGVGEPTCEPGFGAFAQFARLVAVADRKARQDRRPDVRAEGAALGDLDRVASASGRSANSATISARFLKRCSALSWRRSLSLTTRPSAMQISASCASWSAAVGEERLVGGDQRQALAIGKIDQHRLGRALLRRAVPLQLDIEAVAEQSVQCVEPRGGEMALPRRDRAIERPARPAGQRNDALGLALQPFELEPRRLARRRVEEGARIEPHQAPVAGFAGGRAARCARAALARWRLLAAHGRCHRNRSPRRNRRSAGCRRRPFFPRIPEHRTCCRCR